MTKQVDYFEQSPTDESKPMFIDGKPIGDMTFITTHTLKRWKKKANLFICGKEYEILAADILEVLKDLK